MNKTLYVYYLTFTNLLEQQNANKVGTCFADNRQHLIETVSENIYNDYPGASDIEMLYMEEVRVRSELFTPDATLICDTADDNRIKLVALTPSIAKRQVCSSYEIKYDVRGYTQTHVFSDDEYPHCTCPAYHFSKRTVYFYGELYPEPCKHLRHLLENICGWHEGSGSPQKTPGICPDCGLSTKYI